MVPMKNDPTYHSIFITGATGYLGRRLVPELLRRGHQVKALVRKESAGKLPRDCTPVIGNALDSHTYAERVAPADTFVHLVGVSRPNPLKADEFRKVDLTSVKQALEAAIGAGIAHFVYVSVAHPAPVMKGYIRVREECEALILASGLSATILRPWYVLGPGHRWPYVLLPFYKVFEWFPPTAESSRRLGLVKLPQMIRALTFAVENPRQGIYVMEVPQIRRFKEGVEAVPIYGR